MVTKEEIIKAMVAIELINNSITTYEVFKLLDRYRERGQYLWTLDSAIDCLKNAEYKIEGEK